MLFYHVQRLVDRARFVDLVFVAYNEISYMKDNGWTTGRYGKKTLKQQHQ